jgi:excinuclease ABC subunit B
MYADRVTGSMQDAIDETNRRRKIQDDYNKKHNISPESIKKDIVDIIEREYISENSFVDMVADYTSEYRKDSVKDLRALRDRLKGDMLQAAEDLEFEKAAVIRDQMVEIEKKLNLRKKVKKGE